MIEQNAKPGAIALDNRGCTLAVSNKFDNCSRFSLDLDEMLNDIEVPSLDVPELGALLVSDKSKDLFEEKKRKAWKELDAAEARCDFAPNRMRITNRGGVFFITLWKKSVYGRTLTDIKGDDDMVGFFADNITPLIRSVIGSFLSPDDFAVVTTLKRRHKERNFATLIAIRIAEQLGLPFFEDCAFAPSKHRVGTVSPPTTFRRSVTSLSLTTSLRQGKRSSRCRIYSFHSARTVFSSPALTTNYNG